MRKLLTFAPLLFAGACATAQDLDSATGPYLLDDGGQVLPGESGGGGGLTSSGGGANSAGSTQSQGGSGSGGAPGGGGKSNAGGKASTGGAKATGGATAAGGAKSSGGGPGDAGPACVTGQKICTSDGLCWPMSPSHGCGMSSACTPCTGPTNGTPKCTNTTCDFDCNGGYTKSGSKCVSGAGGGGGGGAGGTGSGGTGSGGAPPACDPKQCGGGIPFVSTGCCKSDGTCGIQQIWTGGGCK